MKARIKVIERPWTGQHVKEPEPTENTLIIGAGDFLMVQENTPVFESAHAKFNYSIKVLEVNEDSIKLQTNGLISVSENNTDAVNPPMNLVSTIKKNNTYWFSTPPTDGGIRLSITFLGTQTIKR